MIYVKKFPASWSEETLREYFKPFGKIKSLSLKHSNYGAFCIICYDDEEVPDLEYGPKCAQKAIETLNGRKIQNNVKLVVKHFLQKGNHEHEISYNAITTASSKKACLCV